eukprot:gene9167-9249_t
MVDTTHRTRNDSEPHAPPVLGTLQRSSDLRIIKASARPALRQRGNPSPSLARNSKIPRPQTSARCPAPSHSGTPVSYAPETRRRRTFAIISHPDAGKTTLTEKLLLFSGAIQIAGAVKGRKAIRDPLDIMDEVERELGMPCCPMTWPVGQGKAFGGIINLRTKTMTVFESGSERRPQDFESIPLSDETTLRARFGAEFDAALESMELAVGASPAWDHEAFLAGKLTPVFFGSGVNNFGVMEVLDALVDMAPPPGPRVSTLEVNKQPVVKTIQPEDEGFAGVVFKVQANMDANHRDRIAFVRVASGKYTPGMKLKVQRTAKELRPTSVVTFMSQRREAVEEAYAGDIIGFTTHGGVQLGDTITDGANLQFTGLPFFAPEMFMTVVLKNPLRTKQLQQGLAQLGEEGAIQVFKPDAGGNMLLGAVGQLQFEVVQHRLKAEYDADVRLEGCQYTGARWITADNAADLRAFTDAYPLRLAHDAADTLAYLCTSPYDVRLAQERFPKIHFHPLREHAGLALQGA